MTIRLPIYLLYSALVTIQNTDIGGLSGKKMSFLSITDNRKILCTPDINIFKADNTGLYLLMFDMQNNELKPILVGFKGGYVIFQCLALLYSRYIVRIYSIL